MSEENNNTNQNTNEEKYTASEFIQKFNDGALDITEYIPELKEDTGFERFKKDPIRGPYKSYRELEKGHMKKLPADATPEQIRQWKIENLGVPGDPTKYEFEVPEKVDLDGYKERYMNQDSVKFFQNIADKLGLTVDQAKEYWNIAHEANMKVVKTQLEAERKMNEEETAKMDSEWGDQKEEKLTLARTALKEISDGDENVLKDMTSMLKKFSVWKGLARLGEQLNGSRKIEDSSNVPKGKTVKDIDAEISQLMNDNHTLIFDGSYGADPRKQQVIDQIRELNTQKGKLQGLVK